MKLFKSYSDKEIKRTEPIKKLVEELADKYAAMNDTDLADQTRVLKERLETGETLDQILPDAFAVCREAAERVLQMRHFSVQLTGGIVLHQGRIAEMRTGEGKTLVATLPAYLNALSGKGVHIVTVNDYLAKRDSEWMGKVYRFLGLSVGLIVHGINNDQRREAYNCDITYGTNNEFGFDYLRDNMCIYKEERVQRPFNYAVVDEVDSILIDEARTPLIISGPGDKSTELYNVADAFVRTLSMHKMLEMDTKEDHEDVEEDYIIDEKGKTAVLTPHGIAKAEKFFNVDNLMDAENVTIQHHINQAIRAHGIMHNEVDYVVKDGEVIIVDEFTGRLMQGRRYNEGLHQAIEAKEGVKVERESKTLATITFQNLFRIYPKLSGMTGTALTEESEFREIYKLDVVVIPTNKPLVRVDHEDVVYKTETGKWNAVIDQVVECHGKGQPVLVGTISVDRSEALSKLLKKRGVKHTVLNAKYHDREAAIIAQAGQFGAVTISTNMAGRGTDIMLGGNAEYLAKDDMRHRGYNEDEIDQATAFGDTEDEKILESRALFIELQRKYKEEIVPKAKQVVDVGGLFIIGTERHESRRIDNQLRGRAARQGDPGASKFFISLEDDLMRIFGGNKIQKMMNFLNISEDEPIATGMLTKTIESAQRKVEGRNFGIRKNVLQYDDVMNKQREIIYAQRNKVLDGENLQENIKAMIKDVITESVSNYLTNEDVHDNWNIEGLRDAWLGVMTTPEDLKYTAEELGDLTTSDIVDVLYEKAIAIYEEKEESFSAEHMREIERVVLLRNVDTLWMDHIDAMDELKHGINMRAYAQRDPVVEYRIEGFNMFDEMVATIQFNTVKMLLTIQRKAEREPERQQIVSTAAMNLRRDDDRAPNKSKREPVKRSEPKVGRNDACPCGSGKKYKKCCGALTDATAVDGETAE